MRPDNVILVGFMGAGKSVCGRLLARRLGRCFVETDDMIMARDGRSIPQIFTEAGEARFRALEGETVTALALKSGEVIATGGGLPCGEGRMEELKALGTVVWLRGPLAEQVDRARREGARPMLEGRAPRELEALYAQRERYYAQADVVIDTVGLGPDQVVTRVLAALRARDGSSV